MSINDGSTTKSFLVKFSPTKRAEIVETKMMQEIMGRTLAAHGYGILVAWYGHTRVGKTTTACLLTQKINDSFIPDNPSAFRAVYYEVGQTAVGNGMKKGIRSLYSAVIGRLDEGVYIREPPEALARMLVHGVIKKGIQMVFVDEVQFLSLDAIRGMVLVCDVAANEMQWPLTIIFIGMDDMPMKLHQTPRIEARIQDWCLFREYDVETTWMFLERLHPHFKGLKKDDEEHRRQVTFIHELCGGFPGNIVPFVRKMEYRLLRHKGEIDLLFLRGVNLPTDVDKEETFAHYRKISRGAPVEETQSDEGANSSGKAKSKAKRAGKADSKGGGKSRKPEGEAENKDGE